MTLVIELIQNTSEFVKHWCCVVVVVIQ